MAHTSQPLLVVILSISLFCLHVPGFSIHKRSVDTKAAKSLHEALKVIERQKRNVLFDENSQTWPDTNEDYYGWPRGYPESRPPLDPYDMELLEDLYGQQYGNDEAALPASLSKWDPREYNDPGLDKDLDLDGDDEVSDEELDDLFNQQMPEESNIVQDAADEKREYDPTVDMSKKSEEDTENVLSPEEVNALLYGADDSVLNAMADEASSDDSASAVSRDEIEDMFKNLKEASENDTPSYVQSDVDEVENDDEDEDAFLPDAKVGEDVFLPDDKIEDSEDAEGESNKWPGSDSNKEWLINQYLAAMPGDALMTTKKKRSGRGVFSASEDSYGYGQDDAEDDQFNGETEEDLAAELAMARTDIKVLKEFLALEDEENANLAKALNLATKSQTERSDKYVDEEIQFIKEAIQDEVDLQEVKEVLAIAKSIKGPDDGLDYETENMIDEPSSFIHDIPARKRAPPAYNRDENALDLELPDVIPDEDEVNEDVIGDENVDITDEDLVNIILSSKLKDMLAQNSEEDLNGVYDKATGLNKWYDNPGAPDMDLSEGDAQLNPWLRELMEQLQASKVSKRQYELPEEDPYMEQEMESPGMDKNIVEMLAEQMMCPAVEDLTDNCDFIGSMGLALDAEATDLCNRHSLCYSCGAALDLSPDECDRGYLSEASRLCDEDEGCDEDAAGLFILMLKYHNYQTRTPDECQSPCAENYIAGNK